MPKPMPNTKTPPTIAKEVALKLTPPDEPVEAAAGRDEGDGGLGLRFIGTGLLFRNGRTDQVGTAFPLQYAANFWAI